MLWTVSIVILFSTFKVLNSINNLKLALINFQNIKFKKQCNEFQIIKFKPKLNIIHLRFNVMWWKSIAFLDNHFQFLHSLDITIEILFKFVGLFKIILVNRFFYH